MARCLLRVNVQDGNRGIAPGSEGWWAAWAPRAASRVNEKRKQLSGSHL